jgi:hypothetical protein
MSPVLVAALSQSKRPRHPEAAESLARERLPTKDLCTPCRLSDCLGQTREGRGFTGCGKTQTRSGPGKGKASAVPQKLQIRLGPRRDQ